MSYILYYSNYCENSKNLLNNISKSNVKNDIHFICIDKRIEKNGKIYLVLENNQEIVLPNNINAVPAIMLINDNYKVLFGDDIVNILKPIQKIETQISTNFNEEPSSFSLNTPISGIISDNFSFLDQDSDDLSAKGNGGMRQLYNYVTINNSEERIETPEENYVPDKINEQNIKEYENNRNI